MNDGSILYSLDHQIAWVTINMPEKINGLEAYQEIRLVFDRIAKPSIAMINGYPFASGCGLAMLPTFGITSEKAQFSCPEVNAGVWPMMVMTILFRRIGRKRERP